TTGLDPVRADVINELIIKLQRELKVTSIVVTHDMASAFKVRDRMLMLDEGRIVLDGCPVDDKTTDNEVVRRYDIGESGEDVLAEHVEIVEGDIKHAPGKPVARIKADRAGGDSPF